jgi:O-antigen/teichoic acid export membrane protein
VGTSLLCLFVWLFVILSGGEYKWYYIALMPTLLGTMFDISWFFTGLEQIRYIVLRNTVCKLLGIALLFLLVREKQDLIVYMLINSGISLFGSLSMWSYLPGMLKKVDFKTLTFKRHFRETLVYFIPTIATSIYTVLDKTLIGVITNSTYENGYYEQATKIINIMKSVVFSAVNAVMGSRISYLFAQKKYDEIRNRLVRSIDFIFLLGYGCVFGIIAVAQNFVPIFFGEGYEPVILLLRIMAPMILIIGTSNCLGSQYFNPSGQRAKSAKVIIAGSAVNLVLNLLFIPRFGALGATIASVIAEVVIAVFYVKMSHGYMEVKTLWRCSRLRLLAGVVMMLAVMAIGKLRVASAPVVLVAQVGCGVVIYGIVLLLGKDRMTLELLHMVGSTMKKVTKQGEQNG